MPRRPSIERDTLNDAAEDQALAGGELEIAVSIACKLLQQYQCLYP